MTQSAPSLLASRSPSIGRRLWYCMCGDVPSKDPLDRWPNHASLSASRLAARELKSTDPTERLWDAADPCQCLRRGQHPPCASSHPVSLTSAAWVSDNGLEGDGCAWGALCWIGWVISAGGCGDERGGGSSNMRQNWPL